MYWNRFSLCLFVWLGRGVVVGASLASVARAADDAGVEFFERQVRPLLAQHCFQCHGEERQRGDLRLDTPDGLFGGGASGPAVVPGQVDDSLLIEAINYASFEMPPTGRLPAEEIEILTRWVADGAPWPGYDGQTPREVDEQPAITDEDRQFWSYQPVVQPAVPTLADDDWSRNEVDRFIYRTLHQAGLTPAESADRRTLIRRATFDLTGLPPTPDEVAAFLSDDAPDAYERLIDRLLASPRYGERWARHWLDLVRYAESDGWRQDAYRPQAWRYRDYVIDSLNDDKPYDRFVVEQLAGDEVAPHDPAALTATAFLRHGTYEYNQRDVRTQWTQIVDEVTDVTADVFLGMGFGCARCHDHKFDPILQRDYYRLRAFFGAMLPRDDVQLASPAQSEEYAAQQAAWEEQTRELRAEIEALEAPLRARAKQRAVDKFPPDIQRMIQTPADQREPLEHQLAELAYRQVLLEFDRLAIPKEDKPRLDELRKQLAAFDEIRLRPLPSGMTVCDLGTRAAATVLPVGRGEEVEPGFPTVLEGGEPARIEPVATAPDSTGRRTALARWLTRRDHPLTARVMVNRVWQYHFGEGLVRTPSDFGHLGEPPTHPELLDWLAVYFVEQGWRLKPLHRLLMTSATYRQTALRAMPEVARKNDPENRWLWRMPLHRLDAEQIRDAALAASGELKQADGGPSVDASANRRSIYLKVFRNRHDPLLDVFDVADGLNSTQQRNVTTTAPQALFLLNGPWLRERATVLANRLTEASEDDAARVDQAFERLFGRPPRPRERAEAVEFLAAQSQRAAEYSPGLQLPLEPLAARATQAARLRPESPHEKFHLPSQADVPTGEFTIEAVFVLDSLYDDAAVRTIASQWSGDEQHPGWSLGVTSKRSRYEPRNLIVQLVGRTAQGTQEYHVLPSNLRVELGRTYYACAVVRLATSDSPGEVEFYLQEVSESPSLQKATVAHPIVADYTNELRVTLGGRDSQRRSLWDGLLDEVRLSRGALPAEQLLIGSAPAAAAAMGYWQFESPESFYADTSGEGNHLEAPNPADLRAEARRSALVDLCHVLLNSNEFLYVE